jgi:hypothetical protein
MGIGGGGGGTAALAWSSGHRRDRVGVRVRV